MQTFHAIWAYVVIIVNLGVGLWGLISVRRSPPAPRSYWLTIMFGLFAVLVQVIAGVVVLNQLGLKPGFHAFYGFVILIAGILALAFKGESPKKAITITAGVALFMGAVAIRAVTVSGR